MCAKFILFLFLSLRLLRCSTSPESISIDMDSSPNNTGSNLIDSPTKSILKMTPSPTARMFHSISFSSDTKGSSDSPAIQPDTSSFKDIKDALKYTYKNLEIGPIIIEKPFDYEVDDGKFIIDYNLPQEFQELINTIFLGLESVKISLHDLSALILFTSYHLNIANSPIKRISSSFYDKFVETFADSPKVIKFIKSLYKKDAKRLEKVSVMGDLLGLAFSNKFYYTVEAFYAAFGKNCLRIFLKESIKSGDSKLCQRFINIDPFFKPAKLVTWAIEYENVPVYLELVDLVPSIDSVAEKFKNTSLILYLSISDTYFPGLADRLAKFEKRFFGEALMNTIIYGNHLLFKEMIKYDNSYFSTGLFSFGLLDALRLIFFGNVSSLNLNCFHRPEDFEHVYDTILKLQSDDPKVLEIFANAVPDMERCGFYDTALLAAIYHKKHRNYLKLLLNSSTKSTAYVINLDDSETDTKVYGIWEMVQGAEDYMEIMKDLVECKGFSIFHAIGNPIFPESLWPELIEKQKRFQYVSGANFYMINQRFGFINDSDLKDLGLEGKSSWSLLELAILNFNYIGVKHLLDRLTFSPENLEAAGELAEKVKKWVETSSFFQTQLVPRLCGKIDTYFHGRERHSNLFAGCDENCLDPRVVRHEIKYDINKICGLLAK